MSHPPRFPALAFSPVVFQPIPTDPIPAPEPVPSRPRMPRFEIVIPTRQAPRQHSQKPLPVASKLPLQNVSGDLTEEQTMHRDPDWDVLQAIPCKWQKCCDAVLANITIAAKHFARHMATLNSTGLCGLRRCFHPVNTTSRRNIERHYFDHHIGPRDPDANALHTALPRLIDRLPSPSHLPLIVPSYLLSAPPVRPSRCETVKSLFAVDLRRKRSRDSSVTAVEPIRFDYGDAPFIPMQGDAIVEVRRQSSYIFPHPAAYSTDPTERALFRQLCLADMSSLPVSTSTDFEFPVRESDGDETSAASAVTSTVASFLTQRPPVSSSVSSNVPVDLLPTRVPLPIRTKAPFRIVRSICNGTLPMTIPLADVYADIIKRKKEKGKGRAEGERPGVDESDRPAKIRRIAEKVAYETVGRTIGVDWWEVVLEVQNALEAAVGPEVGERCTVPPEMPS